MKHVIRDSCIALISIFGITWLYREWVRQRGPLVRVLAFHDVADKVWFEEIVKELTNNYHVLTPEEFHSKAFDPKKINLLLTFDDGYETWVTNVLPVLEQYQVKGLFFVISGLLDLASDQARVDQFMHERLLITPKKALSWDGARTLLARGHTIGGHTLTHQNLAELPELDRRHEIEADKRKIETTLNIELSDFAYPFGRKEHYTKATIAAVRESGYQHAYTAVSRFVGQYGTEIPRMCTEKNQPVSKVNLWIRGGYDIVSVL